MELKSLKNITANHTNQENTRARARKRGDKMRPGINRVADNLVYIMPDFIHEFGDDAHHWSIARNAFYVSQGRYLTHVFLDLWIFYPFLRWLTKWIGDNKIYEVLRLALGFFWGINCGFPLRDVALYTVWVYRGCKPLAVFKRRKGEWIKTYPFNEGGYLCR